MMNSLVIYISIFSLIFNTPLSFASDVNLTNQEKVSLAKLGVKRDDLSRMVQQGDFTEIEKKLQEAKVDSKNWDSKAQDKIEGIKAELNEAKDGLEGEAQQVQKDLEEGAEGIAKGYAASSVSLIMLAVFAPSVVMACRTKPSALAYAGTAAVYLTRELMNLRKFKASALSEIKYVEMKIDKSKSLDSNIQTAKKGMNMQFEFIQSYKNVIDKGLKSLEDKAENAKLASIGFGVASALALTETYAFDSGTCVKLGESRQGTPSEKFAWSELLFSKAFANESSEEQLEVKKKMLVKDLKDNKLADLASDSDKVLAALIGGGSIAAAAFIPSYANLLSSIVSNGLSRSVVFAAHGLMAFYVYQALSSSTEKLIERSDQLQALLDKAKSAGGKGLDSLSSKLNSKEIRSTLKELGIDKSAGEMSPDEIENLIEGIETEDIEDDIKEKLPGTSYLEQFKQLLMPKAYASSSKTRIVLRCYTPKRCPPPQFPIFKQSELKKFSAFTSNFQKYAHEVYSENLGASSKSRRFLLRNDSTVQELQQNLYRQAVKRKPELLKGAETSSFDQLVENKTREIVSEVEGKKDLSRGLRAAGQWRGRKNSIENKKEDEALPKIEEQLISEQDKPQISAVDHAVLTGLIERLKYSEQKLKSANYKIRTIHPKRIDLFEAIHRRYQLIFQSQ